MLRVTAPLAVPQRLGLLYYTLLDRFPLEFSPERIGEAYAMVFISERFESRPVDAIVYVSGVVWVCRGIIGEMLRPRPVFSQEQHVRFGIVYGVVGDVAKPL